MESTVFTHELLTRSDRVRFLIQKRVRKYYTKHFPWGTAFIIYILRFKFLLIVFNDKLEGS